MENIEIKFITKYTIEIILLCLKKVSILFIITPKLLDMKQLNLILI
jgi:hypothetical protein